MRTPKVENKYNLKPKDIQKAKILKPDRFKKAPFWRNNIINAYCLSGNVCPHKKDPYGTFDLGYWIGFYDDDAKAYAGKIRLDCSCFGGMCKYEFKNFFDEKEIENEWYLELQEKLLSTINWLIDEAIISIKM